LDKWLCPNAAAPAFAGDGYGQAVVSGLIQVVVSGAIQCEAIRIAEEQKSVSLAKRAEATYAEYRRQKSERVGGTGIPTASLVAAYSTLLSLVRKSHERSPREIWYEEGLKLDKADCVLLFFLPRLLAMQVSSSATLQRTEPPQQGRLFVFLNVEVCCSLPLLDFVCAY
jgi:hypothetical protein